METYIGTKMLEAEPMTLGAYNNFRGWKIPDNEDPTTPGYLVCYPDGYKSWSPAAIFESAYLKLSINTRLATKAPSISQQMVDDFIADVKVITLDGKTTVVRALLKNGFTVVESSSCVSPENYNEDTGAEICLEHIKNQVWKLLGFLLQTAVHGVKPEE